MKRIIMTLLSSCFALFLCVSMQTPVNATDVWVSYDRYENMDTYIMDDTISYGKSKNGPWISVSVKRVQNGRVKEVLTWNFIKYKTDMWRYYTNTMRGNSSVVDSGNKIFLYTINSIGCPYYIDGYYIY